MTYLAEQMTHGLSGQAISNSRGKSVSERKSPSEKKWPRYLLSSTIAAGLTFTLGVSMALMIKTNFSPAEKIAAQNYEINPADNMIEPPVRKLRVEKREKIEVPPATPRIETAAKMKPSEPIVPLGGDINLDWKPPVILSGAPIVRISNQDETPLFRVEPVMPPRAQRSGHCVVKFNLSADGAPYDITAQSCSQNLFERPSIKAVNKWKYKAKIVEGQRVARKGLTTRLSFNLSDEFGKIIPE